MHILIRQLGTHRGAPRLYIDSPALELAGLRPGATVTQEINASEFRLTWRVDADGSGKGSRSRSAYCAYALGLPAASRHATAVPPTATAALPAPISTLRRSMASPFRRRRPPHSKVRCGPAD